MTSANQPTRREKLARRHNLATLFALLSFVVLLTGSTEIIQLGEAIRTIAILTLFATVITMFMTRNADEFIAAIWRAGTSVAFVFTAGALIMLPFAEGLFDGLMGIENGQDLDASDASEFLIIASFFIANGWARLRGTA